MVHLSIIAVLSSALLMHRGSYSGNQNVAGGEHYHLGKITSIRTSNGQKLYSGKHTKTEAHGKWVTYTGRPVLIRT